MELSGSGSVSRGVQADRRESTLAYQTKKRRKEKGYED